MRTLEYFQQVNSVRKNANNLFNGTQRLASRPGERIQIRHEDSIRTVTREQLVEAQRARAHKLSERLQYLRENSLSTNTQRRDSSYFAVFHSSLGELWKVVTNIPLRIAIVNAEKSIKRATESIEESFEPTYFLDPAIVRQRRENDSPDKDLSPLSPHRLTARVAMKTRNTILQLASEGKAKELTEHAYAITEQYRDAYLQLFGIERSRERDKATGLKPFEAYLFESGTAALSFGAIDLSGGRKILAPPRQGCLVLYGLGGGDFRAAEKFYRPSYNTPRYATSITTSQQYEPTFTSIHQSDRVVVYATDHGSLPRNPINSFDGLRGVYRLKSDSELTSEFKEKLKDENIGVAVICAQDSTSRFMPIGEQINAVIERNKQLPTGKKINVLLNLVQISGRYPYSISDYVDQLEASGARVGFVADDHKGAGAPESGGSYWQRGGLRKSIWQEIPEIIRYYARQRFFTTSKTDAEEIKRQLGQSENSPEFPSRAAAAYGTQLRNRITEQPESKDAYYAAMHEIAHYGDSLVGHLLATNNILRRQGVQVRTLRELNPEVAIGNTSSIVLLDDQGRPLPDLAAKVTAKMKEKGVDFPPISEVVFTSWFDLYPTDIASIATEKRQQMENVRRRVEAFKAALEEELSSSATPQLVRHLSLRLAFAQAA
ncbi:MAG: hypothetical protein WCP97_03800 [bacterium]